MNADKAATVRDAINECPDVVTDADHRERDGDPFETTSGGITRTLTGDRVDVGRSRFRPAVIEQSGTARIGDGPNRPVFVVVLEPLWTARDDVRSLSRELVYEIAKHDCRIRYYPPAHRLGESLWIADHISQQLTDTTSEHGDAGDRATPDEQGEPAGEHQFGDRR